MSEEQIQHEHNLQQYSGFHNKTLAQRREILNSIDDESIAALDGKLEFDYANKMIENCVGILPIPVGVCPYLILNNKHCVVPMATEEPSVIAACSNISKLVSENGGFIGKTTGNNMITQIQIRFKQTETESENDAESTSFSTPYSQLRYDQCLSLAYESLGSLIGKKNELISEANEACPRMVARGGGVYDVEMRVVEPKIQPDYGSPLLSLYCQNGGGSLFSPLDNDNSEKLQPRDQILPYIIIYFKVNVCDAMGANIVNTIAEHTAPKLLSLIEPICLKNHYKRDQGSPDLTISFLPITGLRILSNLCVDRITTASFTIPLDKLGWKTATGIEVAKGVCDALQLANDDQFRAVTHNKGVMNGITAAALASGQDTRAIEASIHAYASVKPGNYKPITNYYINYENNTFIGEIAIPIAVGTKGGALGQHPLFSWTLKQLKYPDSQTLAQILASIGLAQNFAAMRALAIEGIQSGHMRLHARKVGH